MRKVMVPVLEATTIGDQINMHTYYSKFVDDPNINFNQNDLKALNTLIREEEEHVCYCEMKDSLTEKETLSLDRAYRRLNILKKFRTALELLKNNPATDITFSAR